MPKRVSKDKAIAYLKEYTTNGFNRTAAHNKINPRASYRSNNVNSKRFHKNIPQEIINDNGFKLDTLTPEYILGKITEILNKHTAKDGDKLKAAELLGDFKRIWSDKGVNVQTNVITDAQLQLLRTLQTERIAYIQSTHGRAQSSKQPHIGQIAHKEGVEDTKHE